MDHTWKSDCLHWYSVFSKQSKMATYCNKGRVTKNRCMNEECGCMNSSYTMSHHSYTALKATSTKQHGTQPLAPAGKATVAQWRQRESVTWDITLSRPIQHCEEHNRQGWPFTHRLPLCGTTDCASPCRATGQTQWALQSFCWEIYASRLSTFSMCSHSSFLWITI